MLSIAQIVKNDTLHKIVDQLKKKETKTVGVSLWVFSMDNLIRKSCRWVFDSQYFDLCSNFMVVFSTLLLAIDNPLDDPLSKKQVALKILDYLTTSIFASEAVVKIVVFGLLFNGPES